MRVMAEKLREREVFLRMCIVCFFGYLFKLCSPACVSTHTDIATCVKCKYSDWLEPIHVYIHMSVVYIVPQLLSEFRSHEPHMLNYY